MSDRQISIRLGKAFWSRGPGPAQLLRATDFPSLQTNGSGSDDLSQLFQAHLELTQLFSNAHDILYSSSSHREHLYVGGEYVRYIVRSSYSSPMRSKGVTDTLIGRFYCNATEMETGKWQFQLHVYSRSPACSRTNEYLSFYTRQSSAQLIIRFPATLHQRLCLSGNTESGRRSSTSEFIVKRSQRRTFPECCWLT